MKTINGKYYQCEHCGRKMFGAGAMGLHEKYCKQNPKNRHKCFEYCRHLQKTSKSVPSTYREDGYGRGLVSQTQFICAITGKKLYSYKREKQYFQYVTPDMERMPLECDHYEDQTINDSQIRNILL